VCGPATQEKARSKTKIKNEDQKPIAFKKLRFFQWQSVFKSIALLVLFSPELHEVLPLRLFQVRVVPGQSCCLHSKAG